MPNLGKIKVVIFDIDGVFTDGTVLISEDGKESKCLSYRDIDGYFRIRKAGLKTAIITGEDTPLATWFRKRFTPDHFFSGCKDKGEAVMQVMMEEGVAPEETCFVGDSLHDVSALAAVGLKACPLNAVVKVKEMCDIVLSSRGGSGAIAELSDLLVEQVAGNG